MSLLAEMVWTRRLALSLLDLFLFLMDPSSFFLILYTIMHCNTDTALNIHNITRHQCRTHLMRKLTLCISLPNLFMQTTAKGFLFKID